MFVVFLIAFSLRDNRPNINYVSQTELSQSIQGIGTLKSKQIVFERTKKPFENELDFYIRVIDNEEYSLGDTTYKKIMDSYKIKDK